MPYDGIREAIINQVQEYESLRERNITYKTLGLKKADIESELEKKFKNKGGDDDGDKSIMDNQMEGGEPERSEYGSSDEEDDIEAQNQDENKQSTLYSFEL